jgi:hypothetical protein
MDNKKYYIPDDLHEIYIKFLNYEDLKDKYCKVPFGFKKAVKCGKEFQRLRDLFWRKVSQLHPELINTKATYFAQEQYCIIKAKGESE